MFLTSAEIQTLTGLIRPSAQIRWLRKQGYRFTVNALGDPVIAIAEANRKLVGGTRTTSKPNWEELNGPSKAA
jgi:hypothetical protein